MKPKLWAKAIEELGVLNEGIASRWMTPEGDFLMVPGWWDHRQLASEYHPKGYDFWREYIMDGGVSVGWDPKARHLSLRTIGLNPQQRMVWDRLYEENGFFRVDSIHCYEYDFRTVENYDSEEIEINNSHMCKLYLTDTIAYQMAMSEEEVHFEDY